MSCPTNPCQTTTTNTAACESLPSQISNFTTQFFGEVVKTEVDGVVSWSLPCGLDVGLPNNPRAAGEGLGCYFLRLFQDGIIGLTGPEGPQGCAGANGNNAYTVTLQSFTQPTEAQPFLQVLTAANPAIIAGEYVFIAGSGWYLVTGTDTSGTLFLQLYRGLSGATGTIGVGKLVVPSGVPGVDGAASSVGATGATGATGETGPQGPAGSSAANYTTTNSFYAAAQFGSTDYNLQGAFAPVTFIDSAPARALPEAGTYLVTAVIDVVGLVGVALTDLVSFRLVNESEGFLPDSEHSISHLAQDQRAQVVINVIHSTTTAGSVLALYGKCTNVDVVAAVALGTTVSYVKISS